MFVKNHICPFVIFFAFSAFFAVLPAYAEITAGSTTEETIIEETVAEVVRRVITKVVR